MTPPLQKLNSGYKLNLEQIKCFECLAYIKVQRKTDPKFEQLGRRVILNGYKPTDYLFLKPEERKYYESRDVRFNGTIIFGNRYNKNSIRDRANL